ncbi:hypothetical protein LCGC14_1106570 [marine sediment metagenome]|uniref:Uncharacterized protein n=1 Tax=marine sediment metagenome TaxID=412755 RepID=A0A0F9QE59_9ZZZZ
MSVVDYKAFLDTSLDLEFSISDIIILRSCVQHILNSSTISAPTRVLIESIDQRLSDSYMDIDCGCLDLDNIVIIKDP